MALLQHIMRTNPAKGATQLENDESGLLIDVERVVDIFLSQYTLEPIHDMPSDADDHRMKPNLSRKRNRCRRMLIWRKASLTLPKEIKKCYLVFKNKWKQLAGMLLTLTSLSSRLTYSYSMQSIPESNSGLWKMGT